MDAPQGSRLLVLIVEDYEDARDGLAALMRLGGHEVTVAADGPQAVSAASDRCPDVVLLDVCLPGFDGYEVGRRIKQARPCRPSFVVAVTGTAVDPRRSDEAGIDL